MQYLAQSGLSGIARDHESNDFRSVQGAGMDVQLTKNIFVGPSGRYYTAFHSNVTSSPLAVASGLGQSAYPYCYSYNNYSATNDDYDKQVL